MKHNWEYKKWDKVLRIINGKNQKAVENPNGKYPIYGSGGIMSYADNYLCPEYCTIIGRKGSINKPIYVETKFWNVDTVFGLCPHQESLNPRFLYYFCVHYDFMRHNRATTLPSLVKTDILRIKMPVPPMEVQQQIVAELDKINEIISDCKEAIRNLDDLAQSLFYDYFGDPITNPKGWETLKISSFAKTTSGGTPSKSHPEYYNYPAIPWLRSGEVCKMNIVDTEIYISELGMNNSSTKLIPKESVVVAMYGATAGQVGIIKKEMTTNQAVCAILPNSRVNSIYLYFYLSLMKPEILKLAHGAAQSNISQDIIKSLTIMVPPLELQERFTARIEQIEQQKKGLEKTIAEMQTLLDSRMDYWFN